MALLKKKEEKEKYIKAHVLENRTWYKDYLLIILIVFLTILFSIINPSFIGINNVFSILRYTSILGIVALGMNIIIITGGFDLSAAMIANFTQLIAMLFIVNNITNLFIIIIGCVLVAVLLSLVNAVFIITLQVPAFIMTLGLTTMLTGLFRMMTKGTGIVYPATIPANFLLIGQSDLGGLLPITVIVLAVCTAFVLFLMDYSPMGRKLYAVGSNSAASEHVGIKVKKLKYLSFVYAGILYGIAGILMASTFGSAGVDVAKGYQFPALIAILLGATLLSLNVPNVKGTIVSAILLSLLVNGFTMINLPFYMRTTVQGLILIFAIGAITGIKKQDVGSEEIIEEDSNIK